MAAAAAAKDPKPGSSLRPGYDPKLWGWKEIPPGILGVKDSPLKAGFSLEGVAVEGVPLVNPLEVSGLGRSWMRTPWGDAVIIEASLLGREALSKFGGSEG